MKAVAVVGPADAGKTTLVERLTERLDGRVAAVKHLDHAPNIDTEGEDTARHRAAAHVTYGLSDKGWFATGEDRSLADVLDDLVPDYDYALVEGFSTRGLPAVVLDGREYAGPELAAASEQGDLDLDTLRAEIDGLEPRVTLQSLVGEVKASPKADRAGAIATFTGRVRAKDAPDDVPTEALEFETYREVADERTAAIGAELEAREGVHEVRMHHRVGEIGAGEDIVFVVVLAGHRREAFSTVEDGIDRLKAEVPIFKKERTGDEEFWVHERA